MLDQSSVPVIAGLAVGIAFVVMFSIFVTLFPVTIQLKEEWDLEGQQKAVDVLLTNLGVRKFVVGKTFEVWAYGPNYPQASLNEGICDKDECTLIGIREQNRDGSTDCALITFVNVETGRVDDVQYSSRCNEEPRDLRLRDAEYRALLNERREAGYELASNDPRVIRAIQGSLFYTMDFEMLERRDVVTIDATMSMSISGTWQEGYEIVLDKKMIQVHIVDDSVTLVKTEPLPDVLEPWNFTDNQKRMISIAFSNPELQNILTGLYDGTNYYVSAIRDRGIGDLGYVVISNSTNANPIFVITINQVTGEIQREWTYKLSETE